MINGNNIPVKIIEKIKKLFLPLLIKNQNSKVPTKIVTEKANLICFPNKLIRLKPRISFPIRIRSRNNPIIFNYQNLMIRRSKILTILNKEILTLITLKTRVRGGETQNLNG